MKPTAFLQRRFPIVTTLVAALLLQPIPRSHADSSGDRHEVRHPNILFIIMDDVGIDQLHTFNPLAPHAVPTPVLDTLVQHGVAFNNFWSLPECSPSRSCFFTGRFPLRTGVKASILSYVLPSAQTSPYEVTTPRVLARAGYRSAMLGKYHLGGPDNNPAGYGAPSALGWDYFNGNLQGGPPSIDPTLGGQTTNTALYPSGFPLGQARGAGWFQGPQNAIHCDDNHGAGYTGQECVQLGGIPALTPSGGFAPTCLEATIQPAFNLYNGYYAWPRVVNDGNQVTSSTIARKYMATAQTDDALEWIQAQSPKSHRRRSEHESDDRSDNPWMCTVSYNSIHTPYQQPPTNLYPPGFVWPAAIPEGNTTAAQIKIVSDLMLYAMDQEIGRLLVGAGLARRLPNGQLDYRPEATDTMIVVVGDNGTYLSSVNFPYNPLRSKASPYQTGVTTPLIISGPLVRQPGRTVTNMVNAVDLFALFGEIAGINVRAAVPKSHILDCVPLLPYLTNPGQDSLRKYNYTELGSGKPPSVQTWPSVFSVGGAKIGNDLLFDTEELCLGHGGEWFGPTASNPTGTYATCCEVRSNVYPGMIVQPNAVWAVRNDRYKLVKSERASCDADLNPYEFYDLRPTLLNPLGLDNSVGDLLSHPFLTPEQQASFAELSAVLDGISRSEPVCPGDGNLDKVVNGEDVKGVQDNWGHPSVFDFNLDGTTDEKDLETVLDNLGHKCRPGWSPH